MINLYFGESNDALTAVDIITIALAVIAIIVSVWTAIIAHRQEKKGQRISLEAEYYSQVFKDYLIKRIPIAWQKVAFAQERIIDEDELTRNLISLKKDALYFRFSNEPFFLELKKKLESIEDELVYAHNRRYNSRQQIAFKKAIAKKLHDLYHYINKQYYGI